MSDSLLVEFTPDELRMLAKVVFHALESPLGVYPGTDRDARAQLTGAFKILRARYTAGGWKFIPLPPNLAPFACQLIVETMAPGRIETAGARKRGRPRKHPPTARRASARGRRERSRTDVVHDTGGPVSSPTNGAPSEDA